MKILILCAYYQRPKMVRNAINSVLAANEHHQDWELVFGDDGSDIPGRPVVEEILKDQLRKVTFINTGMTFDDKINRGLTLGRYSNEVMKSSSAEAAIILCDDDALHPHYLKNLSNYFTRNQEVLYCWSWIRLFNPILTRPECLAENKYAWWNKYTAHMSPLNPVNKLDASQVAWRLDCCKKYGAWFAESTKADPSRPWNRDTDKGFFENLYEKCGPCHATNFPGQFKGIHDYQLLWHKNTDEDGLRDYVDKVGEAAGVLF